MVSQAAASMLCETIEGRHLADLRQLTAAAFLATLGTLNDPVQQRPEPTELHVARKPSCPRRLRSVRCNDLLCPLALRLLRQLRQTFRPLLSIEFGHE